jgi:hypothetical protein
MSAKNETFFRAQDAPGSCIAGRNSSHRRQGEAVFLHSGEVGAGPQGVHSPRFSIAFQLWTRMRMGIDREYLT